MKKKKIILIILVVLSIFNTTSYGLEFQGKFLQGHFVLGKTKPGSEIFVDNKKLKISDKGYFVFGIDRDRKFDILIVETRNGKEDVHMIKFPGSKRSVSFSWKNSNFSKSSKFLGSEVSVEDLTCHILSNYKHKFRKFSQGGKVAILELNVSMITSE